MELKDKESIKLQLLAGQSIKITDKLSVPAIHLGDIQKIGWKIYNEYLHFLTFNNEETKEQLLQQGAKINSDYELILFLSALPTQEGTAFRKSISEAYSFFLKKSVVYEKTLKKYCVMLQDDIVLIEAEVHADLVRVILWQNGTNIEDIGEPKPANSKAAEILAKRKAARDQLEKAKKKIQIESSDAESISFSSMVSAVCAKNTSGINCFNIWDAPVYVFYDLFNRIQKIEQYEQGFQALMAGAKKEEVNLKHWLY